MQKNNGPNSRCQTGSVWFVYGVLARCVLVRSREVYESITIKTKGTYKFSVYYYYLRRISNKKFQSDAFNKQMLSHSDYN